MKINVRRLKKKIIFFSYIALWCLTFHFLFFFIIWRPSLFFLCFSQFCFLCASPTFVFFVFLPLFIFIFCLPVFSLMHLSHFLFSFFSPLSFAFYVSLPLLLFIICVPFLLFWCFSCLAFYVSLPLFYVFSLLFTSIFCLLCVSPTFALLPNSPSSLWEPSRKVSSKRLLPAFSENEKERIFDSHKYNNTAIDWFSITTSPKHKTWHSEHKGAAICMGWKNT